MSPFLFSCQFMLANLLIYRREDVFMESVQNKFRILSMDE